MAITTTTPEFKDYVNYAKVTYPTYSVVTNNSSVRSQFLKTRTREKVDGWRTKIRKGQQATGPYALEGTTPETWAPGTFSVGYIPMGPNPANDWRREYFEGFTTSIITEPAHLSASMTQAENEALKLAYRKVDQTMTQWQGASFLAELGESIAMLRKPLKNILNFTESYTTDLNKIHRQLRNGRVSFEAYTKKASDLYLTWAFGLQPLVSDTRKAAKAIAQFNYERESANAGLLRKTKIVARGYSKDEIPTSYAITGSGNMIGKRFTNHLTECRVQYIVKLESKLHAAFGSAERLFELCGVSRPSKLIPAFWQAVPYSWLVDYFTNAGDILETLGTDTSAVAWVQRSSSTKTWYSVTTSFDLAKTVENAAVRGEHVSSYSGTHFGSFLSQRTSFTRYAVAGLSFPTFEVSLPTDHLGSKLANTAAVLLQRMKFGSAIPPIPNLDKRKPFVWNQRDILYS